MKYTVVERAAEAASEKAVTPKKLYVEEEGTIVHITLKPEAHLPSHETPVNVVFYVVEGEIRIDIGEESEVFGPDSMVESPKNIPHALTNAGSGKTARILVIKMPSP